MPSAVRQVNFSPTPVYSRLPRDDELYVMNSFASHAKRCSQCAHPYDAYLDHEPLCEKGLAKAKDVAQYIYHRSGKAYSKVDSQGTQRMHVEIPHGCDAVRELLKAIERGMQLSARKPLISYDANYYIAPRPVSKVAPPPQYVVIEPSSSQHRDREPRKEKVYIKGRGSLYQSDMAERKQRRQDDNIVYVMAEPRGARSSKHHR